MKKTIAPRGEEKNPGLLEILTRLLETAQKAEDFISRYREAGYSAHQSLMEINLLNFEPYFLKLMRDFRCAMRDLQMLGRNNLEAQHVVRQMLFTSRNTGIESTRHALLRASQVAKRYLAAHPEKKPWKRPGWTLATIIIVAGYAHYWWWIYRGKKRIDDQD